MKQTFFDITNAVSHAHDVSRSAGHCRQSKVLGKAIIIGLLCLVEKISRMDRSWAVAFHHDRKSMFCENTWGEARASVRLTFVPCKRSEHGYARWVLYNETAKARLSRDSTEWRDVLTISFLEDIRDKICFVGMMESCNREFKLLCELIVNVSTYTTIKECLTYPHEIV